MDFRNWILIAGAGAGLALAGLEAVSLRSKDGLPPNAAALVNGAPIAQDDYRQLIESLASVDKSQSLSSEKRAHLLERLIEEELLFQRAQELGLPHSDPVLRGRAVQSMIDFILETTAAAPPPDEETLRRFYAQEGQFFAKPVRLHVRRIFRRTPERARDVAQALAAGADFDALARQPEHLPPVRLPDQPLPPAKLQTYLGETLTAAALDMMPGEISGPIETPAGVSFLRLVARETGALPPFDKVRDQVADRHARAQEDKALRSALDRLKEQARIIRRQPKAGTP